MKTAITKITQTPCDCEAEIGRLFCQALTKHMHAGFNLVKIEDHEAQLELHMFQLTIEATDKVLKITEHTQYHGTLEDVVNRYVIDDEMTIMYFDADSVELAEDETRVYLARV